MPIRPLVDAPQMKKLPASSQKSRDRNPSRSVRNAMADSHIEPRDPIPPGSTVVDDGYGPMESTLRAVSADVGAAKADFIVDMGDLLDYHLFGFNTPPPDSAWARLAYLNFRRMMGDTLGNAAHFPVIGNWDGESGCNSDAEIQRSLSQPDSVVPTRSKTPIAASRPAPVTCGMP